MARNVEIKARLRDAREAHARAEALADGGTERLAQTDVYFHAVRGRLKLRTIREEGRPEAAELIAYARPDATGPEVSDYRRVAVPDADELRAALAATLGERVVVEKHRTVHHVGRTRVHLDEVEGLGGFLELEVVLREGEGREAGAREAERLMRELGVEPGDLVDVGYADLVLAGAEAGDGA